MVEMALPQGYQGADSVLETVAFEDNVIWSVPANHYARARSIWFSVGAIMGFPGEAEVQLYIGLNWPTAQVEAIQPSGTNNAISYLWSTEVGTAYAQQIGVLNSYTSVNPLPALMLRNDGFVQVQWQGTLATNPTMQVELFRADTVSGGDEEFALYLQPRAA